jgi:uncharacterized protein YycO
MFIIIIIIIIITTTTIITINTVTVTNINKGSVQIISTEYLVLASYPSNGATIERCFFPLSWQEFHNKEVK